DNLAAGAWTNPAVKQAAAAWAEIGAKYSDKSFKGLIHTEVQTMQNKDKAANVAGGLEYFRIMLSKDGAKGFYQKSGSMTVVKDSLEGVDLTPGAKSTV